MHLGTETRQQQEEIAEGWQPHPLGLMACILGAAAVIAANVSSTTALTLPLCGLGLAIGVVVLFHAATGRAIRLIFPIAGTMFSGITLLLAIVAPSMLGPRYEVSREKSGPEYNPESLQVIPLNLGSGQSKDLEIDGWVDAKRAAVQQGAIKVMITGASIEPIKVVDSKLRFTKSPYLAITVRVQQLGHGKQFRFVHWGENSERAVPHAIATCNGKELTPANLESDVPVGVKYGQDLFPGQAVNDLLIFNAPPSPGSVRLELPGEAWNGQSAFRLLIPASMVQTQQTRKPRE